MNTSLLPMLEESILVSSDQINSFRKKGHTLIKGVLNKEEVVVYREAINEAAYRHNTEKRALEERDTYGKAFLQIMNLWEADKKSKQVYFSKAFC